MKLDKLLYNVKYTAGSYGDALASIPIWTAERICQGSERLLGEKTPRFLSLEHTRDNSPVYKARQNLRDSLDTLPGALFLQSNVLAAVPFVVAGMPAAELAEKGIEHLLGDVPQMAKYAINSAVTLGAQFATSYTTYMVNEVRANKAKYVDENGKLSPAKIADGFVKAVKAFLSFDIPLTISKLGGQSYLLSQGKDPWKASALFDAVALPAYFTVIIPIALKTGAIETRRTLEMKRPSAADAVGENQ